MKKKKRDQPNVRSEGINPVLIEEFVEKRNAAVIRDIRWMLIYGQVFFILDICIVATSIRCSLRELSKKKIITIISLFPLWHIAHR